MPVRHEDIRRSVIVIIEKKRSEAAVLISGVAEFCPESGVLEGPVAQVVVKPGMLQIEMSDQNVRPAVSIDIGGVDSHARLRLAVFAHGDAGLKRLLAEATVMRVMKEEVRISVVGDENILPSIMVEVECN